VDQDDTIREVCDERLDGDIARCYLVIEPASDRRISSAEARWEGDGIVTIS
jgi:predicted RNA polymerase sigma factor